MAPATSLDAGRTVRICKKQTVYYALIDGLAVFGTGNTYQHAIAELDRKYGELQSFCATTGLSLEDFARGPSQPTAQWRGPLRTAAIFIVTFALLMLPLSYALSSAFERAVNDLHLRGGAGFWHAVEDDLIRSAGDGTMPSSEDQEKTLTALRTMVRRIQPYANEIKPIFGCAQPQ